MGVPWGLGYSASHFTKRWDEFEEWGLISRIDLWFNHGRGSHVWLGLGFGLEELITPP
jgi:hypothetical protein